MPLLVSREKDSGELGGVLKKRTLPGLKIKGVCGLGRDSPGR